MTDDEPLRIFTVYMNPLDFPGSFVVREWLIKAGELCPSAVPRAITKTLTEARDAVPAGLVRVHRAPEDDPAIVESWL